MHCPKGRFAVGGGAHSHFPGEPGGVMPPAITQSRSDPDLGARPTGWVAAGNAKALYAPLPFMPLWSVKAQIVCSR